MSNPALSHLDSLIHRHMTRQGIADTGTHRPKAEQAGVGTPCRVYIDNAMQQMGDHGPVTGSRIVLSILRADVAAPRVGDTLTRGLKVYTLESPLETTDESLSRWVVNTGD